MYGRARGMCRDACTSGMQGREKEESVLKRRGGTAIRKRCVAT